jgi:uncharacterized protein YecE (DUF72 family)
VLYVGTCGYSYPDWIGPFYPAKTKPREMLHLYAHRFAAVEIDSTYYRVASAKTFASMARATPATFRFTAKLPGSLTHLAGGAGNFDDARFFRESIEPLRTAGKFACALMQFPNGFEPVAENVRHLRRLRNALDDLPLVAEFRNGAWQTGETLELMGELDIGWCNVDEPQFRSLMRPGSDATSAIGYVRLHGRNAQKWWRHERSAERYEYLYDAEELVPWARRVVDVAADPRVRDVYAFFNNHRRGHAARNAEDFEALLRSLGVGDVAAPEGEPFAEQMALGLRERVSAPGDPAQGDPG